MFSEMQDYFRNHKSLETIKTKSGGEKKSIMHFFDAGHEKNAGVFERFLDAKTAAIMAGINTEKICQSLKILKSFQQLPKKKPTFPKFQKMPTFLKFQKNSKSP